MNTEREYEYIQTPLFGVNGVTFCNDIEDGGEWRQAILKNLYASGKSKTVASFKRDDYENEFAVKVLIDNKVIGYVPKTELGIFLDDERNPRKEIPIMRAKCEIGYIQTENGNQNLYALLGY